MQTAFVPDDRIGPVTPLNEWKGRPASRGLSRNREAYPGICHSIRPNPVEIHPLDNRQDHSPRFRNQFHRVQNRVLSARLQEAALIIKSIGFPGQDCSAPLSIAEAVYRANLDMRNFHQEVLLGGLSDLIGLNILG
jgi:hypothetical protein